MCPPCRCGVGHGHRAVRWWLPAAESDAQTDGRGSLTNRTSRSENIVMHLARALGHDQSTKDPEESSEKHVSIDHTIFMVIHPDC